MNCLIEHLNCVCRQAVQKGYLSESEKAIIVHETVSAYLSFNYTETVTYNNGQPSIRNEQISADLNYDLLFGSKKSNMIENVKTAFNVTKELFGMYNEATGHYDLVNNIATNLGYGVDAIDGDYLSITSDVIKDVSKKYVNRSVTQSIGRGLLPQTAKVLAPRILGTFFNVLIPLDAGGPTRTDSENAAKKVETDELHRNVLAGLMFYFINGNQFDAAKIKQQIQDAQKQKVDNTNVNRDYVPR